MGPEILIFLSITLSIGGIGGCILFGLIFIFFEDKGKKERAEDRLRYKRFLAKYTKYVEKKDKH